MAKHKRYSDKTKNDSVQNEEKSELIEHEVLSEKPSNKITFSTVGKYICLIASAALVSGIFTPLTLGIELDKIVFGMLTLFLGLGGGVLILFSVKNQESKTLLLCAGLGLIFTSVIIMYELAELSLFHL
tara:strand:- start:42 stop:428 length:387 start_codon:yes stop_codon:yes gene_type:complete